MANGSDAALGSMPQYNFSLDTTTAGFRSATITATTSSPQVPQSSINDTSSYQVVNAAEPSFSSTQPMPNLNFDFGTLIPDGQLRDLDFEFVNLLLAGASSNLDLDSITGTGDIGVFANSLTPISGLPAGSSESFTVSMQTTQSGIFAAGWNILASDEDIPGETTHGLTISVTGRVALPGDANLDGTVDGNDFVIWNQSKFQAGTNWMTADFNFDGNTDGTDFIIWNQYKFQSLDAVSLVPEPSCCGWLLLALWIGRRAVQTRR
jgi:hypothetical protein